MKDIRNIIEVGIVSAREIKFRLPSPYRVLLDSQEIAVAEGDYQASSYRGMARVGEWQGRSLEFIPFEPQDEFELSDVVIGINFHWERHEAQRFRCSLRFVADAGSPGQVIAINSINVEEYLKSVISSEMSASASEALLCAHAVISRSWLLRQLQNSGERPEPAPGEISGAVPREIVRWYDREDHRQFDVCADDHCQRYQGTTRQTSPAVSRAVDLTRGEVLAFGDEICDARFSKCCGGRSETFDTCWQDADMPYLQPVDDPFCNTTDATVLRQVLNDYDRETTDFYRWEVCYSAEDLSRLVAKRSGIDFGTVTALEPLERGASGRIRRLKITGTKVQVIVGKELEIRKWLSETHLRSSAFDVEQTIGATGNVMFRLKGKGWGHGVGLCQIGAAVMGAKGYSYRDILSHYFPGAELRKIY